MRGPDRSGIDEPRQHAVRAAGHRFLAVSAIIAGQSDSHVLARSPQGDEAILLALNGCRLHPL